MPKPITWNTEKRKVSDLVPHPKNPRQMTEKQEADLTESLEKFGLAEIPVVNKGDNQLLAGHQRCRVMALLGRGDEEIDVRVPVRKLTKGEADEYLIRSNKNTGEWDFGILSDSWDSDKLVGMGFEEWEVGGAGDIPEKETPEAPESFTEYDDETIETQYKCPKCAFEWSGQPK